MIPVPALRELVPLIGTWRLTLWGGSFQTDPEGQIDAGLVHCTWTEDGAALTIQQHTHEGNPPAARWIIGRDQDEGRYTVLYSDARGVSRVYMMSFDSGQWHLWRDNPSFAQRFEAALSDDGSRMIGRWEKAVDDGPWEHDFYVEYTRVHQSPSNVS